MNRPRLTEIVAAPGCRRLPLQGSPLCSSLLLVLQCILVSSTFAAEPPVDFQRDIVPILETHCVKCHSPGNSKGEISLETAEDLLENTYLVPGDPDESYLVELITHSGDEPPRMPKGSEPLSAEQVVLIRQWIAAGASWPEEVRVLEKSKADSSWWSLQPLANVEPPSAENLPNAWKQNPIDRFIFAKLAEQELRPNEPADRRTLIRRVTYDLTGLPPTPEEVAAFEADTDPTAYEKLVDRLLSSPHYGERWGRHWLDVVRFGESIGFERNVIVNDLWPFRDYVIESLNEDKPFDQFIREHLAGDVFGRDQPEVEIGSAFLVAGPYDDVGNQDAVQAAQIRANTIDEIIRATSEAFLGLTVGCARCHDHKFDPILQRDYYSLYATFSGIRHGSRILATPEEKAAHEAAVAPRLEQRGQLSKQREALLAAIQARGRERADEFEKNWTRDPVNRQGTEETFPSVEAKFIRLISEGQDNDPNNTNSFGIDEFEAWSAEALPRNVASAALGAKATGKSRENPDFPGSYGPQLAIDGRTGARFLASGGLLTIEFAAPTKINKVRFSSALDEAMPENVKFAFVAEYRIGISADGASWTEVANSRDRRPVSEAHRVKRLRDLVITNEDKTQLAELKQQIDMLNQELAAVPPLQNVWLGQRVEADAKGPFHVFLGGSPQRKGQEIQPASLTVMSATVPAYLLETEAPEAERRTALADWIVHRENPLSARVLANRLWHYHFGTGIVDTPSDFGYMGGQPTHPELLDWLAARLHEHNWRLKPLHKLILLSRTYQQASTYRSEAAEKDADARLLWRYPPRRLSAEEVRDTILMVSGKLDLQMGGPGFRLYRYLQDNVATYIPLDQHGPETYRRAIYHQNARAAVVDLMTEFDQPDCAFATPRRAETTTPLQALTMLNHSFTLDMARFFVERIQREAGDDPNAQINRIYALCFERKPSETERSQCAALLQRHSLETLCRVMLNTSELIFVE